MLMNFLFACVLTKCGFKYFYKSMYSVEIKHILFFIQIINLNVILKMKFLIEIEGALSMKKKINEISKLQLLISQNIDFLIN